MADALSHRGPDASGLWRNEAAVLAHRRLSIIDLGDGGAQPMLSASGRWAIAFNGEIYNYREIRDLLRAEGWRNRSESDTEVILGAVENWGLRRFLDVADGMFAFALVDVLERRLHLVRDPFGEKPLVWCEHGGRIYFASELRSLEAVGTLSLGLCEVAVKDYFRHGYVTGDRTIFRNVHRVRPATWLEFDLARPSPPRATAYWEPSPWHGADAPGGDLEELIEILDESVRVRMISDRPLGAFLSGGIDSAVTCALAARHSTGPLRTYTMGWEQAEHDESEHAAVVARELGAEHHDIRLPEHAVIDEARHLGLVMDEPFADSSLLAVRMVAAAARQDVVVALSGDGGDELFAGYNRHRWLLKMSRPLAGPRLLRCPASRLLRTAAPVLGALTRPIPLTKRPRLVADKTRKLARVLGGTDLASAYLDLLAHVPSIGSPRDLDAPVRASLLARDPDELLWALRVADLRGYLPDDVMTKVDRATMSVSLESRTPFLNRRVAAWALAQPREGLLGASTSKLPLRAILGRLLPDVVFDHPKAGFGVPVADLLRGPLAGDLADAARTFRARDVGIDYDWEAGIRRLGRGNDEYGPVLWSLLMFEYWHQARRTTSG